jgi:hypothetical protein
VVFIVSSLLISLPYPTPRVDDAHDVYAWYVRSSSAPPVCSTMARPKSTARSALPANTCSIKATRTAFRAQPVSIRARRTRSRASAALQGSFKAPQLEAPVRRASGASTARVRPPPLVSSVALGCTKRTFQQEGRRNRRASIALLGIILSPTPQVPAKHAQVESLRVRTA